MMKCPKCGAIVLDKPRSTGKGSESNHLHGHLQTMATALGYYMSEMKDVLKADCTSWPHVDRLGHMMAVSEADVTSAVEHDAIEWCHAKAAELGIRLNEQGNKSL